MKVTVAVVLDDGTEVKRIVEVDSSDNGRFWSNGIKQGAEMATFTVCRMVEAVYGTSDFEGIHLMSAAGLGKP